MTAVRVSFCICILAGDKWILEWKFSPKIENYSRPLQNTVARTKSAWGNPILQKSCPIGQLLLNLQNEMEPFQKKTQKTPVKELAKAIKIKREYYEEKKRAKRP